MNDILPLAEKMLRDYGEFYPYGGYIKPNGEIVHVGAKHPETDRPKSNDLIHILRSSFQDMARAKQCKAVAIICDVRVRAPGSTRKTDAIQVMLDHIDNYSMRIFLPYQISNKEVVYGNSFAWQGERDIFGRVSVE
jgi:hypothetical protein